MEFAQDYALTLLNAWFAWVGGALVLNEISGMFVGRSWKLPRQHRLTAACMCP